MNGKALSLFEALQEMKQRKNMTWKSVFEKTGLDEMTVANWRKGVHRPFLSTFLTVVQALGGKLMICMDGEEMLEIRMDSKAWALFIGDAIESSGFSFVAFCESASVGRNMVYSWINSCKTPFLDSIVQVLDKLGMELRIVDA